MMDKENRVKNLMRVSLLYIGKTGDYTFMSCEGTQQATLDELWPKQSPGFYEIF
jgi:hypothetical protein